MSHQKKRKQNVKTCDICKLSTGVDTACELDYGPWMQKNDLQVHYFCLLLSTDLPQNGKDNCGILGFQLRDIRRCIMNAEKNKCCFCKKSHATLKCAHCSVYFHLVCGEQRRCLFQFIDEFQSYCSKCIPLTEFQCKVLADNQIPNCYICKYPIAVFNPASWVYGPCCENGFVHSICMRRYALSAGYYLKCIWCKSVDFRNMVRRLGVFVPDRDADWERDQNAFQDLHRSHQHCDMEKCLCPNGRNYSSGKWELILCECCGGFGAHNPVCIKGDHSATIRVRSFKCSICGAIDPKSSAETTNDMAYLISKSQKVSNTSGIEDSITLQEKNSYFSNSSVDTVCQQPLLTAESVPVTEEISENTPTIIDLCSQPLSENLNTVIDDATQCDQVGNVRDSCFSRSSIETIQHTTEAPPVHHVNPNSTEITNNNSINNTNDTNFITFRCVTFNELQEPSGIALVRIDLNSPRFHGISLNEISENSMDLLEPQDIVSITSDLSIIVEIDKIINRLAENESNSN